MLCIRTGAVERSGAHRIGDLWRRLTLHDDYAAAGTARTSAFAAAPFAAAFTTGSAATGAPPRAWSARKLRAVEAQFRAQFQIVRNLRIGARCVRHHVERDFAPREENPRIRKAA